MSENVLLQGQDFFTMKGENVERSFWVPYLIVTPLPKIVEFSVYSGLLPPRMLTGGRGALSTLVAKRNKNNKIKWLVRVNRSMVIVKRWRELRLDSVLI